MEMKAAATALGALAQESRLSVFRLLAQRGPERLCAGEIADQLNVPPATLSFHLKELANAGLVDSHRQDRSIIYALRVDGISQLMTFLTSGIAQFDAITRRCCPVRSAVRIGWSAAGSRLSSIGSLRLADRVPGLTAARQLPRPAAAPRRRSTGAGVPRYCRRTHLERWGRSQVVAAGERADHDGEPERAQQ